MCEYEETLLRLKENKIKGEPSYVLVLCSVCAMSCLLFHRVLRLLVSGQRGGDRSENVWCCQPPFWLSSGRRKLTSLDNNRESTVFLIRCLTFSLCPRLALSHSV